MCKGKILFMKKDPLYKSFGYAFQGFSIQSVQRGILKYICAAAILVTIFRNLAADIKDRMDDLFYPIWTYSCTRTCQYCGRGNSRSVYRGTETARKKGEGCRSRCSIDCSYFCGSHWYLDFYTKAIRCSWSVM